MRRKPLCMGVVLALLVALVALSVPAYGVENATITGDGVNVRDIPSVWAWEIYEVFNKGTRILVTAKTDFTDTIGGRTAPWYKIERDHWSWVFGAYVELDPGVTLDLINSEYSEYSRNQVFNFIEDALKEFGEPDSEIIKSLGQPVSRAEYDGGIHGGMYAGWTYHSLTYDGISFELIGSTGEGVISEIDCRSGYYEFSGLRVGSPVEDVKRLLGDPYMVYYNTDGFYWFKDGVPVARGSTDEYILSYREYTTNVRYVFFGVLDGKVTEITISIDYAE